MTLDPELAQVLSAMSSGGVAGSQLGDMNVVLMMRSTESIMAALGTQLATDERVTTENRTIAGPEPGTDLGLRIYTPKGL